MLFRHRRTTFLYKSNQNQPRTRAQQHFNVFSSFFRSVSSTSVVYSPATLNKCKIPLLFTNCIMREAVCLENTGASSELSLKSLTFWTLFCMKMEKKLSASAPLTPHQWLCPWTPLRAPSPDSLNLGPSGVAPLPRGSRISHPYKGDKLPYFMEYVKCQIPISPIP